MKLWVKSDWNGFFGLFTNNLTNILTMAVLLSFVVGLPDAFVYGRILPAVGFAIFLASLYYTWMAYRLAKKQVERMSLRCLRDRVYPICS